MSEEPIIAGRQAEIELEQTEAAFKAIREAMISRLLKTGIADDDARRALVLSVQSLDLVREKLGEMVRLGNDAKALAAYADQLAEQGIS